MIRSSKITLNFTNNQKIESIQVFRDEYILVVRKFVDILWNEEEVSPLLPSSITKQVDTWLSARMLQCAGKQASGIVRGTKKKQEKRKHKIESFLAQGQKAKTDKLQKIYDSTTVTKPDITEVNPELDSRFVKIDLNNKTTFDGWITLTSIGNKLKIQIPFKRHKHLNKLLKQGKLKLGVRLGKNDITLIVELPDADKRVVGSVIGIDVGQKSILSCSNGQQINQDKDNHTYESICDRLSRKKKGSKSFARTQKHRTNFINWAINQIQFNGIKRVNLEKIKHLRKGRRTSASLRHWNYAELFDRLEQKLETSGVLMSNVNPAFTSQRCSKCGWVEEGNRKGKVFCCQKCGYTADADFNASTNISLDLEVLPFKSKLQKAKGFFWNIVNQEPIVPDTLKPETSNTLQ